MDHPSPSNNELLKRVADRLATTPSASDYAVLAKWRILTFCQYLLGLPDAELEETCRQVLGVFAAKGVGPDFDVAIDEASGVARRFEGSTAVLPTISGDKRGAVSKRLDEFAIETNAVERALSEIDEVRERVREFAIGLPLTGFQYRFDRIAEVLEDPSRSQRDRSLAAAAVRYVKEESDVIPDSLGIIGLMDDDYALRITLETLVGGSEASTLHWSERVAALWEDLPFLQGVTLNRDQREVTTSWLDRLTAYVVYTHALGGRSSPLAMLVPSIESSPLHTVIALLGLLTLDGLTAGPAKALDLRVGQTYEVDGKFHVRFEGVATSPPGWLTLGVRVGRVFRPPSLVDRMVPVDARQLTRGEDFPAMPKPKDGDPIQRFFHWGSSIGASSISKRLALVASSKRAHQILHGIESHGVKLLEHGLVRFLGEAEDDNDPHSALILVVSSLTAVRRLIARRIELQCLLVDGYEPIHKGRHEMPFLKYSAPKVPIVVWTPRGYYPPTTPSWLDIECIEATRDDLAEVLKLDVDTDGSSSRTIRQALDGPDMSSVSVYRSLEEARLIEALRTYIEDVRTSSTVPDHWRYHLVSISSSLLRLVSSTPARWVEVRAIALGWMDQLNDKWDELTPRARQQLAALRGSQLAIGRLCQALSESTNATAEALRRHLDETACSDSKIYLPCNSTDQLSIAAAFLDAERVATVVPVMLRDLPVCGDCIVAGWEGLQFARRLFAHSPASLTLLAEQEEQQRWANASRANWDSLGPSLVGTVYGRPPKELTSSARPVEDDGAWLGGSTTPWEEDTFHAVVLGVSGRRELKVLARQSRVYVEEDDTLGERSALELKPADRVILGSGMSSWSPAEEFTEAVVEAVRSSNPKLVSQAKEWRRRLRSLADREKLSIVALQAKLKALGIERETQTIEGWINLSRASPISPQKGRVELEIIWRATPDQDAEPLEAVLAACRDLRRLRARAGTALIRAWKGESINIAVDSEDLSSLVNRLKRTVEVYQIETISSHALPSSLEGCWLPQELVEALIKDASQHTLV